jgi:hypothetical protein
MEIFSGNPRKVIVSREDVAAFNAQWPCSTLRATRHYWFEFDSDGDLVDCDVPEHDDGPAASAMADDARAFLETGDAPAWAV